MNLKSLLKKYMQPEPKPRPNSETAVKSVPVRQVAFSPQSPNPTEKKNVLSKESYDAI